MVKHVALIMDGNRRWAKKKRLPVFAGHRKGYQVIEKIVERAQQHEIPYVTFWAFSTENWERNEKEVMYLMQLFRQVLKGNLVKRLIKKGGRIKVLGNLIAFPEDIREGIARVVEESKDNTAIQVNVALNYGGREEILQAVQQIVSERVKSTDITEELFSQYLYTKDIPDPDLVIRTGGAVRLSGYLPWQSVYSELYFTDTFWPDFDEEEFDKALEEYEKRERRFGR
jgi:undecaprenyl diphosphate synthase